MIEDRKSFLHWFYHERSGLLFPRLLGIHRIVFEIPLLAAGVSAWYAFLMAIPEPARRSFLSILESPWLDASFLGVLIYGIGVGHLRDRLNRQGPRTKKIFSPGRILDEYRQQFGDDAAVKVLAGIRFATFGLFLIGALLRERI